MTRIQNQQGGITSILVLLSITTSAFGQSLFRGISFPELIGPYSRTYDPANPSESCYEDMYASDLDGDGLLNSTEYNTFVTDLSEGDFDEDNYVNLPFVLKVNFVYLSCLCQFRPDVENGGDCCKGTNGGIYVSGADPNEIPLDWEDEYLRTVCSETQGAIDYARIDEGLATASPTESPVTGSPVTGSPTVESTPAPSDGLTESPTDPPSLSPSKQPTPPPTLQPPTSAPTMSEPTTAAPTESPTPKPVTDSPTKDPVTDIPTALPSGSPVDAPTTSAPTSASPTQEPSTKAPIIGTGSPTISPTTNAPVILTGAPTPAQTLEPTTSAPIVGTGAPIPSEPTSTAPIIGTGVPTPTQPSEPTTSAPIVGTAAPTPAQPSEPTTTAPMIGTGAPTPTQPSEPTTKAPIIGTAAPTPAQVPTSEPPAATPRPTSKAPTPGGTPYPSLSSQPSSGTEFVTAQPWYSPETPSVPPPTPDNPNIPGIDDGGSTGPGGTDEPEPESLSTGEVVGIVFASAIVVYAAAYVYATRRKRERDDPNLEEVVNKDLDDLEAGNRSTEMKPDEGPNQDKKDGGEPGSGEVSRESANSDAAQHEGEPYNKISREPSYDAIGVAEYTIPQTADSTPHSPKETSGPLVLMMPPSPSHRKTKSSDSSSAGESGWSSSAGVSSLNTASFDAGTDDGLLLGSPDRLLATLDAANTATETANTVQRDSPPIFLPVGRSSGDQASLDSTDSPSMGTNPLQIHSKRGSGAPSPIQGKVTRDDLNAAIEAGDWAVVGATAALLADPSTSQSDYSISESDAQSTGRSLDNSSYLSTSSHSDSNNRTRELDRMVETGDWEGVVLAAAQFEGGNAAEEDTQFTSKSGMSTEGSSRREEIRAEVERLVRRVVPDELDNIDEMMLQFEGREEELIETLRTMQERSVAQRARAAVQKTAKLEAKAKASLSNASASSSSYTPTSGPSQPRSALGAREGEENSRTSTEPSYYGSANDDSSTSDFGDYADRSHDESSISDLGMTSEDQTFASSSKKSNKSSLELAIEKGDWRAVGEAAAIMGSSGIIPDENDGSLSSSLSESQGKNERVYYLDALIAKGDWSGIVAAAGKYQAMDDKGVGDGPLTEEEREALAQADMWQTIANQSKQDSGAKAKGAVDAADWAISRSLEQKMKSEAAASGGDPDSKKPRIVDDESV
ncbi:hypothetical protein ACHAXR_009661 [Thalassiosira sp. AJA248-18]